MEKQYFGRNSMEKILSASKVGVLLALLLYICSACQHRIRICSPSLCATGPSYTNESLKIRFVTSITSDGDTCEYQLNANNRIMYIGGYLSDIDRNDTIFYKFRDNQLIGFHYATGIKSEKEDSLEIVNSINSQYECFIWLWQMGVKFISPDIDKEEVHDVYTVLNGNKEMRKIKSGCTPVFEVDESYGRNVFGTIIGSFLNNDSRLLKFKLCVDSRNRIVQEVYSFTDTQIRRTYQYLSKEYIVRVYQDGKLYYKTNYKASFNL